MLFHLQFDSPIPPYEQIVAQVIFAIASGTLEVGSLLPSVRELGPRILVHPNTVAKAYSELEHEGLVEGRPGVGTFVLKGLDGPPPHAHAALRRSLLRWIRNALEAGLDHESVEALFDSTFREAAEEEIA